MNRAAVLNFFHIYLINTGLIIDAFGELRDQLEQVKEDMEVRVQNSAPGLFCIHNLDMLCL